MSEVRSIEPYWSKELGTWVFDDPALGVVDEPFVQGAPAIIDEIAAGIPNARDGVRIRFSNEPFPGCQRTLTLIRQDEGGWYRLDESPLEGWLCPVLFKYFDQAPPRLYVRAEPKR